MRLVPLTLWLAAGILSAGAAEAPVTTLEVFTDRPRQALEGMGGGAIFYEGHITSLAARGRHADQEALYDAMFRQVRTDFLHLMIRHDHEPENDNADPYLPAFRDEAFAYAQHTLAICQAAKKRQPRMRLYATLYTPPAWMKTNRAESAGGESRATLVPGSGLELAEFCWAFLDWMRRHGQPVEFLSIANEPDWPHTQPGYCLTPASHAELLTQVAGYLDEMATRHPETPRAKLVAPNVLSAVDAANAWVPPLLSRPGRVLDVVGSHDYDRRGDRWRRLVEASGGRPVWCTEWCVNGKDESPGLLRSAGEYWLAMSEAFNGGATAWMAYDWVYPPRPGGEALIHVDWGSRYSLTKIYHGYRQWCQGLRPGMRVVETRVSGPAASGFSKPGLKAAAFMDAARGQVVVHAAAVQDQPVELELSLPGWTADAPVRRWKTDAERNAEELPATRLREGRLRDVIPPRGMASYRFGYTGDPDDAASR